MLKIKPESVIVYCHGRQYSREFFIRRSSAECAALINTLHDKVRRRVERTRLLHAELARKEAGDRALIEEAAEKLQVTHLAAADVRMDTQQ